MQYQTEHNGKGGIRFNVQNPPAPGTKFRSSMGETVTFDEIGLAGMLACTGQNGQSLYMPNDLTEIPDGDGVTDDIGTGSGD